MRGVIVHGLLALMGLVLAYQTWTRVDEEEPPPGEATIAECGTAEIASFVMKGKNRNVIVEPKRFDGKKNYWITVETIIEKKPKKQEKTSGDKTGPKKPENAEKKGGGEKVGEEKPGDAEQEKSSQKKHEAEPEKEIRTKQFLANKAFEDYLKWINPLRAIRLLGKTSKERLKEFELEEVDTRLELDCGKETHTIEVGGRTYGKGDRYVRRAGANLAYLLRASVIRDLQMAAYKFMQKDLHDFALTEVDEARIESQGKTQKLLHRNRQTPKNAMWVDAGKPDRRNRLYDNWFDQVSKLKAFDYLPIEAEPGSELEGEKGEVEQLFTISYLEKGKQLGKTEMVRVDADKKYYYVRTEKIPTWVEAPRSVAKLVAQDVAMVVGLEEKSEPDQEDSQSADKPATQVSKEPTQK